MQIQGRFKYFNLIVKINNSSAFPKGLARMLHGIQRGLTRLMADAWSDLDSVHSGSEHSGSKLVSAKWEPKLTIALPSITTQKGGSGPNRSRFASASDKIRVSCLQIDCLIHMPDEAVPYLDIDELANAACEM